MAAITSVSTPVRDAWCARSGAMRYRPMATPEFVDALVPGWRDTTEPRRRPGRRSFDRKDDLQDHYLRSHGESLSPPRTYMPASTDFAKAVELGLGWGMLPGAQSEHQESVGNLVAFDPAGTSTCRSTGSSGSCTPRARGRRRCGREGCRHSVT